MNWLRALFNAGPKAKAAWLAIAITFVSGFEGVRLQAYRDPVGIPTICMGETLGVKMGDVTTREACDARLATRLLQFDAGVQECVHVNLPDSRRVASVSFAYNIGLGAFCKSTYVKLLNAGNPRAACDELLKWNKATKAGVLVTLPGLTRRRAAERQLCLQGL